MNLKLGNILLTKSFNVHPSPFSSPVKTGTIGASRVCKAAMFSRFKGARDMTQRHDLAYASTYVDAKVGVNQ